MPRRKYVPKKAKAKTSNRSKSSKTRAGPMVQRNMVSFGNGFPKAVKVTHTYIENTNLTSTSGVPNLYRYSVNGLYDPNITSTGHQPLYFDQLAVLYNHYTVIGSKIQVNWVNANSTSAPTVYALIINDDTTSSSTDPLFMAEQPGCRKAIVGYGNSDRHVMTQSWSAKKMYKGSVLGNTNLEGSSTSNPNEQAYYDISFKALDGLTTVSALFEVRITYIAIWRELKDVASS